MAIDKKYLEEAMQMLSGGFENQRVQLNNSFNQNVASLEGQKAGVNQNFDNQLAQNARNTTRSRNEYNNNTISRGLGRSTIATSGMAGIQDQGNRIANQVNEQRTAALGNIEAQKTQLQQALQESLLGLTNKQESETLSLARQLEEAAYQRQFELDQFNYQKEQQAWENAFREKQFNASRSGGYGGSSGGGGSRSRSSSFDSGAAWSEFESLLAYDIKNGTYESGRFAERIASLSPGDAARMRASYQAAMGKRGSQVQQSAENRNTGKMYYSR